MNPRTPDDERRLRHALVVVLAFNAGATDAIGFIALGGAFTSVMTGNLVLFGVSMADGNGTLARHTLTAILCFMAGAVLGGHLSGTAVAGQPIWPRQITRALFFELVIFAVFSVGWWLNGSEPRGTAQLALLAANAVALGVQSSSVQRFGITGLSTTYMTGTLTTLIVQLTSGHRLRHVAGSLQLLCGLVAGAICATLLVRYAPVLAPLIQLCSVAAVLAGSLTLTHSKRETATASASNLAPG